MKACSNIHQYLVTCLAIAVAIGLASCTCHKSRKVTLDKLPAAVNAAVVKETAGASIKQIEAEKRKHTRTYTVEFTKNGKEGEIELNCKGDVIEREQEVTLNDVPAAAKATLLKAIGAASASEIEMKVRNGKTIYTAEYPKDGKKMEIVVDEQGSIVKSAAVEDDDDDDDHCAKSGDDDDDDDK